MHHRKPDAIMGKVLPLRKGADAALLAAGSIAAEALQAAEALAEKGIALGVYSVPCVKPLDEEMVLALAHGVKRVYTLEEGNVGGGLFGAVAEVLAGDASAAPLAAFGLQNEYTAKVGSQQYLRGQYGMGAATVAARVESDMLHKI